MRDILKRVLPAVCQEMFSSAREKIGFHLDQLMTNPKGAPTRTTYQYAIDESGLEFRAELLFWLEDDAFKNTQIRRASQNVAVEAFNELAQELLVTIAEIVGSDKPDEAKVFLVRKELERLAKKGG